MNVSIIGTGYVGLVTGAGLAELGNKVWCVDIDDEKIKRLNNSVIPFYEKGLDKLVERNLKLGRLKFTTSLGEGIKESQIIFIAVGTPAKEGGEADLTQVISVAEELGKAMEDYKMVVIKSTVPVGTFPLVTEVLKRSKKTEIDFDIVSNPEFLREGDAVYDFFHPTRVIIGTEPGKNEVAEILKKLFAPLKAPVLQTGIIDAQMVKYASNVFLACRVSFVNEIANICEKVGADVMKVVKGMSYDKRLGEGYLRPGIGFGGPCLIKDLKALIKMSENYGYNAQYLKSILEKNEHQVNSTIIKLKEALGGVLYRKVIGVWGLTFKAGTNDVRNSLSMRIIELLRQEGAQVQAYDPQGMEEARSLVKNIQFCSQAEQALENAEALLILTGWPEFAHFSPERMKTLMRNALVLDGVNLLNPEEMRRKGFIYRGVGR